MGRLLLGLMACVAAMLVLAQSAWAQGSITVSATTPGASVVVEASGSADSCAYLGCSSQAAEVEVTPYRQYGNYCDAPVNPQGSTSLPAGGGSFDFTTTAPVSPGQQYLVCGYIVESAYGSTIPFVFSQSAVVTVPPSGCTAGTPHALSLNVPGTVAYGRQAPVAVVGNNSIQTVAGGSLAMQTLSATSPFYAYTFTQGDVGGLNNGNEVDRYIRATRGDTPAKLIVNYQESESAVSQAQCFDQITAIVQGSPGNAPRARLLSSISDDPSGVGVSFSAPGGCVLTRPVPAVVTLRGSGANSTISTSDECRAGSWQVRGHTPGVSTSRNLSSTGSTVELHPAGPFNRSHLLTVRVAGQVVGRGLLTTIYDHYPSQRVYQGTDEFVNYCIDGSKTIYSFHLRLFCWLPGSTSDYLALSAIR